jgi:hypothetical protein
VADRVYDKLMPAGFFSTDGRFDRQVLKSMSKSFVEMKLLNQETDPSHAGDTANRTSPHERCSAQGATGIWVATMLIGRELTPSS